jgi:flagellar biogenesis protein FliO
MRSSTRQGLLGVALALWTALPAWAQQTADPALTPAADEGLGMAGLLARTLVTLGIVILIIYLVLNVGLRRLMGIQSMPGAGGGLVKVLERQGLEPKRSVYVVEAAGEFFLVGSADGGLTLLSKLDPEAVRRLQSERSQRGSLVPFLDRLKAKRSGQPPAA